MYTALRFRVQQSWRWIPSRLDAVDMGSRRESWPVMRILFVGKFTPSADRHTDHFPAARSRQARERKPDNVFRKQCNGELAPELGSDQRNYGQNLSETGTHLARLRMLARSLIHRKLETNAMLREILLSMPEDLKVLFNSAGSQT